MRSRSLVVLCLAATLCLVLPQALPQTIPNWAPNTAYAVGALVMFNGVEYKCIQAHTSQVGWEPPNVPALWQPVSGSPQPTPTPATPTPTPTPTATPTPTPSGGGGGCAAPWSSSQVYTGGMMASVGTNNYTAAFWTQNQNPTTPGNSGPPGSGDPWGLPVSCSNGPPTPTPTPPKPTPTPTPLPPGALNFAVYKDVTINANFNNGAQQTNVTGTVQPVTAVMPNHTLVWAFASGTCGAESWAGITSAMEASNIQTFINAGKTYIISTGGAAGTFDCPSTSSFISFINTYNSPNLVGIDFDIEGGQSQQTIDNLINATIAAEAQFPHLQFSFTIPTLGGTANPITAGGVGTTVVNEIKRLNLGGNYVVNLMAMDYGSASAGNCVVVNGACDMGQSAIDAAQQLHSQAGIPMSHIGLTVDIGQNDTQGEITSLPNVDTICNFAKSNGLAAVRFWSFDRDTPNGNGGASTMNGIGAPALAFNHEYLNACGVQ